MVLVVHLEVTHGQLRSVLWTPNPLPQPIPVCRILPCHLTCVHLYLHTLRGVAWLENHAHSVAHVLLQNDTVKEVHEDVKVPLYPVHLLQYDQSIFGVKIFRQALYQMSKDLWAFLHILCHHHPVAHERVHKNVENCVQEGVSLFRSV